MEESKIKKSYLMWIGSDSYKGITDWTDEAITQGISKRLPNVEVGRALLDEGTVIFVAHDEGETSDCPDCMGTIENPEKRKVQNERRVINKEIAELDERIDEVEANNFDRPEDDVKKDVAKLQKLWQKRIKKEEALRVKIQGMADYIEAGTGGAAKISVGGKQRNMDYRAYNYRLHQPKRYDNDVVVSKDMCKNCGGTGTLPEAKVFGLFVPDAVEYILKPEDGKKVDDEMKSKGVRTVTTKKAMCELKRKCGKRHAGGVYVVTDVKKESKSAKEVVDQLVKDGQVSPEGVELNGNFIRFLAPIDVDVKRFRGIKRWSLDPRAEDEADMILDAL